MKFYLQNGIKLNISIRLLQEVLSENAPGTLNNCELVLKPVCQNQPFQPNLS